mgnify:CR=1 FL=1
MSEDIEQNKNQTPSSTTNTAKKTDVLDNMNTIISLIKNGAIPEQEGMSWLKQSLGLQSAENNIPPQQQEPHTQQSQNNDGYTVAENYTELFDYLKKLNPDLNKENYNAISGMIGTLENQAVENYTKKADYEKNLNSRNSYDKSRMTSNAQGAGTDSKFSRSFSRAEIGKMSTKEFLENEEAIMDQMRKGLIRR